ncbi:DUF771 domain-containing protein [Streptococcus hyovaginalis]|uniref:DUF771 domain-containing protein n=1 Tax=Streptococcus hyovaginalis TaxID=149015 RepID=UPI0004A4E9A9|nr:DUF771 domain-containing protein [Streptococcus hyovaginalis]
MKEIKVDISDISIKLPDTYCIVSQSEYDELVNQCSIGRYLSLSDVLEMLSVSRPWLLENVLYKSAIRKEIDIDQNPEGFVKYPHNQGGRYFFLASKTKDYFEKHFKDILS